MLVTLSCAQTIRVAPARASSTPRLASPPVPTRRRRRPIPGGRRLHLQPRLGGGRDFRLPTRRSGVPGGLDEHAHTYQLRPEPALPVRPGEAHELHATAPSLGITLRKSGLAIRLSAAPFPPRFLIPFALTIWGDRDHRDPNPAFRPGSLHPDRSGTHIQTA